MLNVIPYLLNYNIYSKYNHTLNTIYKDNKELSILFKYLDNIHSKYNRDITFEEYCLYVLTNCQEKDKETLTTLLQKIKESDSNNLVLEDILKDVQKRHQAYELALLSLEVSEGRKDFSDLLVSASNLNAAESDSDSPESIFVTNDLEELYEDQIVKPGLRWRLKTLNRMLGSLRQGDFGFIFARPETGKTTFLASEETYFAEQIHAQDLGPILHFNNEEQGSKVQLRLYQAMLGVTLPELFSDVQRHKREYLERGGDKIKIFDSAAIHRTQVEQLVREFKPSLIIFDQIDKIKGFTDDREDIRLGTIYIWARELAKQYCPVIGVCQAAATGEGKRYLTMDDVAQAKTSKQAEADWILGIGKTHAETGEFLRHLHLSKNKLTGDPDTDPNLRHGRQDVEIKPEIARYADIGG